VDKCSALKTFTNVRWSTLLPPFHISIDGSALLSAPSTSSQLLYVFESIDTGRRDTSKDFAVVRTIFCRQP
jgi:hypothetical protein